MLRQWVCSQVHCYLQVQWLHDLILTNQALLKEHIEISMFSWPTVIFNMACHYVIWHAGMNPKNTRRSVQPVKHIPEINVWLLCPQSRMSKRLHQNILRTEDYVQLCEGYINFCVLKKQNLIFIWVLGFVIVFNISWNQIFLQSTNNQFQYPK